MDSIRTDNNVADDRNVQPSQMHLQTSGSTESQMVSMSMSMTNQMQGQQNPQLISTNQQQRQQSQQDQTDRMKQQASNPGMESVRGQMYEPVQQHQNQQQQQPQNPGNAQDPAKRREILSRRPSYRKILNELSGPPDQRSDSVKDEPSGGSKSSESSESESASQGITSMQPPTAIYQTGSGTIAGLQTFSMANALGQTTLVPQEGGMWLPGNQVVLHDSGSNQMYQIRNPNTSSNLSSVVMSGAAMQSPQQMAEEASRKRELRLMKNREAAKECRRRKKEYVKCLETRVAVLENQNKQLIDELKTLKELYVHNKVD